MAGVLAGFSIIWTIIAVGILMGRTGILGDGAQRTLSQFSFWVASPCLLFLVVSATPTSTIFSAPLIVALISAWATAVIWVALCYFYLRYTGQRAKNARAGHLVMSAQAASQVNSSNLGIPLTTFVLGDASYMVPVLLFQLAINTPVYLIMMDAVVLGRKPHILSFFRSVATNPMVLASLLGTVFAVTGWQLPELVMEPIELIAGAAIPCMLAAFGMSLTHHRPLQGTGSYKAQVAGLSALKLIVMPAVAWACASALGLQGQELYGAVLMAALPTAQNIYVAAVRYSTAEAITRDVVLVTSLSAMLTMAGIALFLA